MEENLHKQLEDNTQKLIQLVKSFSTEAIVNTCANQAAFHKKTDESPTTLSSPYKQRAFFLGLMLTTDEPVDPIELTQSQWENIEKLLNEIFFSYALMFFPKPDEVNNLTDEWRKVREVAMPAFLQYFNSGLLATTEQITDRIKSDLCPFDIDLKKSLGISASNALIVADYLSTFFQNSLNELFESTKAAKNVQEILLNKAQSENWSILKLQSEARDNNYFPHFQKLYSGLLTLFKIKLSSLIEKFGEEIAIPYWNLFVAKRGEVKEFFYLTERNVIEEKPLILIEKDTAMCPLANSFYNSLLLVGENTLNSNPSNKSFLKKRDKTLEKQIENLFRVFLGEKAKFFPSMYETDTLHNEHDLIILYDKILFVIEAKASPPVEPFRDPNKAFQRIKRAFQSDRGIQKAYEQGNRIRKKLLEDATIKLYNSDKECVLEIYSKDIDRTYCFCITRDDFGALSVDLSLLLEKNENEEYPWAVNIFDLESILNAWRYFGWGIGRLCEYLEDRIKLNGKVVTADELELAGFFFQHGNLNYLVSNETVRLFLSPGYSDVFDKIYETKFGGEEVTYNPTEPFEDDLRDMLQQIIKKEKHETIVNKSVKKIGRNQPCMCGSGKKYKHCCGKNI